ncbi:SOS response-associated peptidase family protein [Halomicrobium urmianum]|uniref:SOS response-associated peptidase family protein n=1 Tax=Halomicrobium urmianum TaxID=1586233 RepID=UPI001CDA04EB|nr:SOS response-associated peptidase family protein [Halomicrobium urmianum]
MGTCGRYGLFAPSGESGVVESFAVVTTEPSGDVADLHHRMAVTLEPGEDETWLRGDPAARRELLRPSPGDLSVRPVSRAVTDPGNDSPAVLATPE